MQPTCINDRVEAIKDNEDEINRFVEEYKPFIASCTEKVTGRYVRYGEDDELSVALMAFVEAIKSFQGSRGNFLTFAQAVIKRRIIDYYRKEKRHTNVVLFNEYYVEDDEEKDITANKSIDNYHADEISEYRKFELEELKEELKQWDISFFDLAEASPKHTKTKKLCRQVIEYILSRPDLIKTIKKKRYLPIAEVEGALKVPRKNIERARKYIIAVVIIRTGDYQYIRDYVNWDNY